MSHFLIILICSYSCQYMQPNGLCSLSIFLCMLVSKLLFLLVCLSTFLITSTCTCELADDNCRETIASQVHCSYCQHIHREFSYDSTHSSGFSSIDDFGFFISSLMLLIHCNFLKSINSWMSPLQWLIGGSCGMLQTFCCPLKMTCGSYDEPIY